MKSDIIEMSFVVNTYDIDVAGHVNNIVYIRWLEDMRTGLLKDNMDLHKLVSENYYPVIMSTKIRYKKQIKLFDKPIGVMKFSAYDHKIITFEAVIRLGNIIAVKAEQKCAIVNLKSSSMVSLKTISQKFSQSNR